MVAHFGLDVVRAYMRHVQDNAEECVRRVIGVLKDGEYACEMDNGAVIRVKITIGADRRSATIDFAGTSPQLASSPVTMALQAWSPAISAGALSLSSRPVPS